MPRHSHQDALDSTTYNRLLDACDELDEPYAAEARFILVVGGRLGLRAGEIAHFKKDWVNFSRQMIEIPAHEPCSKGRGGDRCGYCYKRAREAVERDDELTLEAALEQRWNPKTSNSVRAVPFGFADWIVDAIEEFLWRYDEYEHSRVSVNRRMDRLASAAGLPEDSVYPHALRATAATHHAYRGLPAPALQSLMGWSKLSVAEKYLRLSGSATADALNETHSDD